MIFLNLKNYPKSLSDAVIFTEIAKEVSVETGVRIVVAPPVIQLKSSAERYSDVFAQHVDALKLGSTTGSLPVDSLKTIHVKGSLINHSEKRIGIEKVKSTVEMMKTAGLETLVCAESADESAKMAELSPRFIAVEPPELIGSGISVSNAKPEIVTNTVEAMANVNPKVIPLCGAGVSNKEDVMNALKLGAKGVLLASAFVNSKDPKVFLQDLASVF